MPYYLQSPALGSCSQALSYRRKWALAAMLGLSQSTDKNGQGIHPPTHPPIHSPSRLSYGLCSELAQCWHWDKPDVGLPTILRGKYMRQWAVP